MAAGGEADRADGTDGPDGPHPTAGDLEVQLVLETDDVDPPASGWVERQLVRLARLAGADGGAVSVVAVDDARMRELHAHYRGTPTTTDVLSFDLRDRPGDPLEADLVVCVDEARRQASRRGHDVRLELLLYALHGLLHLLGYDDHAPADARRMHQREDELLTQAGLGAAYRS